MTEHGGDTNLPGGGGGVVFSLPVTGGTPTALLVFSGTNGNIPQGSLTLSGSTLFGTTLAGGKYIAFGPFGYGNVFSINTNGGGYADLYDFNGSSSADPNTPQGTLALSGSTLYGTTSAGGAYESGTVFALSLGPFTWSNSGGGSWNTPGNWTPPIVPNGVGWQAILGNSTTASSTINLDGNQTVGSLTLNNSAAGYTLAAGSGGTLTLNNASGTGGSQLLVVAGSRSITAPMTIAGGDLTVTESNHSSLSIAGNIHDDNGAESLALNGDGTGRLVLSGTNAYGGGTDVDAGMLIVESDTALPAGSSLTVGDGSGFAFDGLASVSSAASPDSGVAAVPEPPALALLGAAGIIAAVAWRRRGN
jgi:autotransporter-associated beta strand protein/uncharacterized repeat protein (TIGR03803 family)